MLGIRDLSDVSKKNTASVGGKAASLGEMINAGIVVPPGFVITAKAYGKGMTPELEKEIIEAFDKRRLKRVAVRSSAVAEDSAAASWAGQLETYLNVTRDNLIEAVQKCWASIGSEHAQAYGSHHNVKQDDQAVAVVVQSMVDSEVSGVMFTANPVTNDKREIVIESVYGLGEMIVQGTVTPENFIVNKDNAEVTAHSASRQKKMLVYKDGKNQEVVVPAAKLKKSTLNDKQIKELAAVAKKIERHYGHPQDIEWAIAGGKLYIVQSRPITTLEEPEETLTFTYEKIFTREESLMFGEIEYIEFVKWLAEITPDFIPPTVCRVNNGLLEVWLCRESTQIFVDEIYRRNLEDEDYLKQNVKLYKKLVAEMLKYEKRGAARNLDELRRYLALFGQIMVPLHVIFFTSFREDAPKPLSDLAMKVRGEDAVFDNSDIYVRDSLVNLYPACNGLETLIGLKDLDSPDPKKLKRRENDFFWAENEYLAMDFDTFQDTHPSYNFLIDEVDPNQKVITGTIAFKGHVKGEVQVISRKKDIANFKEGNILVAPMTTPHYMPAMHKAKAFITDEGGVTCHAAIVSRELKTPCIIGTKVATQVLKNGDFVDVDANKGQVTVLGQSEQIQSKLSKLFSREKGIWYAYLWNECDRVAFEKYLGYKVKNNLFIRDGEKVSVWYALSERESIANHLEKFTSEDKSFIDRLLEDLDQDWRYLEPYLVRTTKVVDFNGLEEYYTRLRAWWLPMTILFTIPQVDLPNRLINKALVDREKVEKYSDAMDDVWNDFWKKKAPKYQQFKDIFTPQEAFSANVLTSRQLKEVAKRLKGVGLLNGSLYSLSDLDGLLSKQNIQLEEINNEEAVEITGDIAYKGSATGQARLVLLKRDIPKLQEGEILVADMTSPQYLSAIQRSAAIVTDEGGVMCHAAIIARELKKPCIIGTGIATKVLKNGDKIVVDANKGKIYIK